jgi:ubiquinol-cytochrome c reductase cytochrome c subunit
MPIGDPDDPTRPGDSTYDDEEVAALVGYVDEEFDQPGPDIPEVEATGDLAEGHDVYQEQCAACHATTGIGGAMLAQRDEAETAGIVIPDFAASGPTEVGEAVRTGPGAMPVFGPGVVNDDELDAVARYVEYLKDPGDRGGAPIGRIGPVAEGAVGWVLGLGILLVFIRWVGTKRGEQG